MHNATKVFVKRRSENLINHTLSLTCYLQDKLIHKSLINDCKYEPHMPKYQKHKRRILLADFRWFFLCMCIGMLLGWLSAQLSWGIVFGLLLFFSWRFITMQKFVYWINNSVNVQPPEFSGGFGFIAQQLYESQQQEKLTHKKMMDLVKKIRNSLLALQDAVILVDKDDQLEWWNKAAEKLLHLREESQGSHILKIIRSDDFSDYYYCAATPNDGIRLHSWIESERFLQCELTHFGDEKLLIIYDVTRLQHLEQMRKDFVANVSHELRTPLTVLMGYIETFSDQPDIDPKWQRGFNLMTQQTKRMNSIINDLLMLSRLENEEEFAIQCVDMPRLLMHLFDDAQVYNKEFDHVIDLHIDAQKNVMGSEMYLNSALLNLVTNAIKYTPKGGEISITWSKVKGGCMFSVSDNGIGIAQEHIERLTERFYRVDSGRSRSTGGTGLGLAIVKHVLYQHDAILSIESVENQGSTFNIFFPNARTCQPELNIRPNKVETVID